MIKTELTKCMGCTKFHACGEKRTNTGCEKYESIVERARKHEEEEEEKAKNKRPAPNWWPKNKPFPDLIQNEKNEWIWI
jgi:hypothetical protein